MTDTDTTSTDTAPSVYPTLRYDDVRAAIRFLTDAFGLIAGQVYTGPDGAVVHAQLSWANGVIMIGPRREEPGPFDTGKACLYLATDNPDAVHDRAVAAGATVVAGLVDQEYGSREFAAADPEGNLWCFGTYRPAAATAPSAAQPA
jgi:uncharacterized glyoxalase superfamily protein PhnB